MKLGGCECKNELGPFIPTCVYSMYSNGRGHFFVSRTGVKIWNSEDNII
jgi:hypothetical protein